MGVMRDFISPGRGLSATPANRVVEPELDMNRLGQPQASVMERMRALFHWLVPGASAVGSPMRSVDRELEEAWPSRER